VRFCFQALFYALAKARRAASGAAGEACQYFYKKIFFVTVEVIFNQV
jgi:hypothetical protein